MAKTQKTLADLANKTETAKDRNKGLESECIRVEGDCQGASNSLNIEINRNRDLTTKVKNLDNATRYSPFYPEQPKHNSNKTSPKSRPSKQTISNSSATTEP